MAAFHEVCRPTTFDDVAGQSKAISRIKSILARGDPRELRDKTLERDGQVIPLPRKFNKIG